MNNARSRLALLGLIACMVACDLISPNGTTADVALSVSLRTQPSTSPAVKKVLVVTVTAYSPRPSETDSTPFETASLTRVRHGIVATNLFPFGTRLRIPEFFGDEIFVVEDRMHPRKKRNVDVWMASTKKAIEFGRRETVIEVLS